MYTSIYVRRKLIFQEISEKIEKYLWTWRSAKNKLSDNMIIYSSIAFMSKLVHIERSRIESTINWKYYRQGLMLKDFCRNSNYKKVLSFLLKYKFIIEDTEHKGTYIVSRKYWNDEIVESNSYLGRMIDKPKVLAQKLWKKNNSSDTVRINCSNKLEDIVNFLLNKKNSKGESYSADKAKEVLSIIETINSGNLSGESYGWKRDSCDINNLPSHFHQYLTIDNEETNEIDINAAVLALLPNILHSMRMTMVSRHFYLDKQVFEKELSKYKSIIERAVIEKKSPYIALADYIKFSYKTKEDIKKEASRCWNYTKTTHYVFFKKFQQYFPSLASIVINAQKYGINFQRYYNNAESKEIRSLQRFLNKRGIKSLRKHDALIVKDKDVKIIKKLCFDRLVKTIIDTNDNERIIVNADDYINPVSFKTCTRFCTIEKVIALANDRVYITTPNIVCTPSKKHVAKLCKYRVQKSKELKILNYRNGWRVVINSKHIYSHKNETKEVFAQRIQPLSNGAFLNLNVPKKKVVQKRAQVIEKKQINVESVTDAVQYAYSKLKRHKDGRFYYQENRNTPKIMTSKNRNKCQLISYAISSVTYSAQINITIPLQLTYTPKIDYKEILRLKLELSKERQRKELQKEYERNKIRESYMQNMYRC